MIRRRFGGIIGIIKILFVHLQYGAPRDDIGSCSLVPASVYIFDQGCMG